MSQTTPIFSERVRFNWAFHDGTREAQQGGVRDVTNHYDSLYATAYRYGVASFNELQARTETSDEAWAMYEAQQLAELQALGFADKADYDEHQRILKASRDLDSQQQADTNDWYKVAKAIKAGQIKRLYLAGHNSKRGLAVALEYTDAPPVRFYQRKTSEVREIVERFNRRFGTLQPA
ncbi:hypothetical protein [Agrobacterium tumefaciens]|uniref:hypothetical protein n=1 Tax=Agrobacterium tumefaciens TaxID=358 RepID=UPI001571BE01|nr:hypothetical protein [Agrobacterium tumefaciens]NTB05955.1 hypothetical protein [Agrobacterium tumefaciens]